MQPDGEIRLIVELTTEIYLNPFNSLHISEETELVGMDGKEIQIENLQPRNTVEVILEDSFVEETPFYYPTVYKAKYGCTDDGLVVLHLIGRLNGKRY